jgi:hypothetical protein
MCKASFCDECIKVQRITNVDCQICKECGGKCDAIASDAPPKDSSEASSSFFSQLPSVFAYPFVQGGAARFFIGVIFFSLLSFISAYSVYGLFLALFIAGYICAWFIGIIHATVNGEDALAAWPEFSDFWSDIVSPYFLVIGATLLCRLPALAAFAGFLILEGESIYDLFFFIQALISPFAIGYAFLPWYGAVTVISLEILGALYFPMAVLAVAMFGTLGAVNPRMVLGSIAKVPGPYAIVCFLFFVMTISALLCKLIFAFIPLLGAFFAYSLTFYLMVVQARILGLIYRTSQKQLAWFELA